MRVLLCVGPGSMCVWVRGEVSLGWPWLESWRRAEVKQEICRKDTHHFPHYYFFFLSLRLRFSPPLALLLLLLPAPPNHLISPCSPKSLALPSQQAGSDDHIYRKGRLLRVTGRWTIGALLISRVKAGPVCLHRHGTVAAFSFFLVSAVRGADTSCS